MNRGTGPTMNKDARLTARRPGCAVPSLGGVCASDTTSLLHEPPRRLPPASRRRSRARSQPAFVYSHSTSLRQVMSDCHWSLRRRLGRRERSTEPLTLRRSFKGWNTFLARTKLARGRSCTFSAVISAPNSPFRFVLPFSISRSPPSPPSPHSHPLFPPLHYLSYP